MYRRLEITLASILIFIVAITGQGLCDNQSGIQTASEVATESAPNQIVKSVNRFGFKLFSEIVGETPEDSNVFISPLSVACALSIAYNGASGKTRKEIAKCLELEGLSPDELNQLWRSLIDTLSTDDSLIEFSLVNSLWTRIGKIVKDRFIGSLSSYYCQNTQIDFKSQSAIDIINAWVSRATTDRISVIADGPYPQKTAAVLLNATYFKGTWKYPFDKSNTRQARFHLAGGSETDCQMMLLTREDVAVGSSSRRATGIAPDIECYFPEPFFIRANGETGLRKAAGITLPYGNGRFRMTILVPFLYYNDSSSTIDTLMNQLTYEMWRTTLRLSGSDEFDLWLPKFTLDYSVSLRETLQSLGMETAFIPGRADFSNMFANGVDGIDEVIHRTFVRVDETGTEAAAVTAIVFPDSIPPEIRADRPFVVIIHEERSGIILFIGKIANPIDGSAS